MTIAKAIAYALVLSLVPRGQESLAKGWSAILIVGETEAASSVKGMDQIAELMERQSITVYKFWEE